MNAIPIEDGFNFEEIHFEAIGNQSLDQYTIVADISEPQGEVLGTIVCIHGWAGNKSYYSELIFLLGRKYRIIAVDLRGHGDSDVSRNEPWTTESLAIDLKMLLDYYFSERDEDDYKIILMGSSLGSAISLKFYEIFPERVEKMILISPTRKFRIPWWLKLGARTPAPLLEVFNHAVISPVMKVASAILGSKKLSIASKKVNRVRVRSHQKLVKEGLETYEFRMEHIKVPTLIIVGEKDQIIPPMDSMKLVDCCSKYALLVVRDHGHLLLSHYPREITGLAASFILLPEEFLMNKSYEVIKKEDGLEMRPVDPETIREQFLEFDRQCQAEEKQERSWEYIIPSVEKLK